MARALTQVRPWRRLPLLLITLALVRGLLYVVLVPPWQAPDEPEHYQYVRLIMDLKRIPAATEAFAAVDLQNEVYRSLQGSRFWELRGHRPPPPGPDSPAIQQTVKPYRLPAAVGHPPLYYGLCALLLWPFRSAPILTRLLVLRVLSVLLSVGTVWVTYNVARWLAPADEAWPWAAGLFVAFLPMHTFMAGAVNNDALAELLSSLVFLVLAWTCLSGLSPRRVLMLVLLLLLALLTKRTTLFLVPLVLLSLPLVGWGQVELSPQGGRRGIRRLYVWLSIALAGGCALWLLLTVLSRGLGVSWWEVTGFLSEPSQPERYTGAALGRYGLFMLLGFASFWANFGWMNVPLDVGWYAVLAAISLVAGLGWLRGMVRLWRVQPFDTPQARAWAICGLGVLLVVAQALASVIARDRPLQGRYLFPGLAPLALCFTWGLFQWAPERYRPVLLRVCVVWWVVFDGVGVLGYALPHFYG